MSNISIGDDASIHGRNTLEINQKVIELLMREGHEVDRASGSWNMMKTSSTIMKELYNVTLRLNEPLLRWNTTLTRGILLETLDYFLGRNPGYVTNWYSIYREYSAGGNEMPYSYGQRVFGIPSLEINQWEMCVEKLKRSQTTRHGWITLHRPLDRTRSFVPCTTDLYFQVNSDGRLDMSTYMRSQDAFRGLPMDLFAWTMFHEQMSLETDIPLGMYRHIVANLHYYMRDKNKIDMLSNARAYFDVHNAELFTRLQKSRVTAILNAVNWTKFSDAKLTVTALHDFLLTEQDYWPEYVNLITSET